MKNRIVAAALALLACASASWGQGIPTGTISGRVTSDGQGVAGVLVEATSPSLQGRRSATTGPNGDYTVPQLPPGEYTVSYALEGMVTINRTVKVSAAQSVPVDIAMAVAGTEETVTVTASADAISSTSQLATTMTNAIVEALPTQRTVRDMVLLTPGVTATGPGTTVGAQAITIAGSQSYESLFMVDGVVINENLRGQPLNLFVEDAIEETTTSVSGISAEYGRFAGGVVNTVTKSGGNDFHGSLRDVLSNDRWTAPTDLTVSRVDKVNSRYEATLGGRIVRDRLWFFTTGRQFDIAQSGQTLLTNLPYELQQDQTRLQGKLTLAATDSHRFIGTYTKIDENVKNEPFGNVVDLASLKTRSLPQDLYAVNYSGVFGSNLFATAQFSNRHFTFVDDGGLFTDRIRGTVIRDNNTDFRMNAPTFCGVCKNEKRDNENLLAKISYFASPSRGGSHELALGVDSYNDIRNADNHQSGSDFHVFSSDTIVRNGQAYPVFLGNGSTDIEWFPIFNTSRGTNFKTNSAYVNDHWRVNDRWSVNLGLRYDKNDGKDSSGAKVVDDSKFSPRLGVTWDASGDGRWLVTASAGQYVTAIANTIADLSSSAGTPAQIDWLYDGPDINADPNGPLLSPQDALRQFFNWFDSIGGVNTDRDDLLALFIIPGGTTFIEGQLVSPSTTEYALGLSQSFSKGAWRADVIRRESHDFYAGRKDLSTGQVVTPAGRVVDKEVVGNIDDGRAERTYTGLLTQFRYQPSERLRLGGSYTLSRTYGNITGETSGSGPVRSVITQYPEYKEARWNSPKGDLASDQRHRLRLYGTYDLIATDAHHLSAGILQSFSSGTPYGAVGAVNSTRYLANPGYRQPPVAGVAYYYTARDAFHTPNVYSTDLSLNYSFIWKTAGANVELFLQPQVLNVFNRQAPIIVDTTVFDNTSRSSLARFNPFTETPVEGVHWVKGANFGRPLNPNQVQTPRTFRLSLGIRF